jgi:hypothetical protein
VSFAVALVLAALFASLERRTAEPMLDVELFRNLRFTAASLSVAITFFALAGFIFLVTQYFQSLKGWGPLSTGVRLLPVAMSVAISSVLGTRLAVRVGTKAIVGTGLLLMGAFYLWVASSTSLGTGYLTIAIQMLVLGTGMGLASAPATEAIMGVVPKAKAGVGSAVNDATRLMGGTLGVAIIGSIYLSLYTHRLTATLTTHLPSRLIVAARSSAGAAEQAAHQLAGSHPQLAGAVRDAASAAFLHGFHVADAVAGCVAFAGAAMAFLLLPAHPVVGEPAEPSGALNVASANAAAV